MILSLLLLLRNIILYLGVQLRYKGFELAYVCRELYSRYSSVPSKR
ncbi:unnamed protein product [Larinioides sclopetarius]|uniref:Uncharacterized protein n=1 Tax=Larinioides sclopetarius TaxID=280406 RepID=A0AAV2B4V2_9ARAC